MSTRLIKTFPIETKTRPLFTFSDKTKIRLNDDNKLDQKIELKPSTTGFPTDSEITVLTPTFRPQKLKKWILFEACEEIPSGCEIGYRVVVEDPTSEVYFDGTNWNVALFDTHYSTADQIRDNLDTFPLNSFSIAFRIKLKSDGKNTPSIRFLKICYEADLVPWDDLIYDTIIRSLQNSLRPVTVIEAETDVATGQIDLAGLFSLENSGYAFTSVRAAYNLTSDPRAFVNIADTYVPGAVIYPETKAQPGVVDLTQTIAAGNIFRLEMEYEPTVAVYTDQDFYEVERLPSIVFEKINSIRPRAKTDQELGDRPGECIRNFSNGTAITVPVPRQSTIQFEFAIHAHPIDIARLVDAMDRWVSENRTIQSFATDQQLTIDTVDEITTGKTIDLDDVVSSTGAFQVRGAPFYFRPAQETHFVSDLNLNFKKC